MATVGRHQRRRILHGAPGLRPLSIVTAVDELMQIAEDGGNLRERWNYRLARVLDRSLILPMTIVGQGLSQMPHLANLAINGHYNGGWPISALQIAGLIAGYGGTFLAKGPAEDYVEEYDWRREDVVQMLARAPRLPGAPQLSPLASATDSAAPADPLEQWIAVHRQAVDSGATVADAVKKANKIVYGDARGRYGKHTRPDARPSPSF